MIHVVLWILLAAGVLQGLTFLYDQLYFRRETWKEEQYGGCDCRTPKKGRISMGYTFVCDQCARKWYYTHDNIAWAGWAWAPFWKRVQIRLGCDHRLEEDPPEKTELAKKLEKENLITAVRWVMAARERKKHGN